MGYRFEVCHSIQDINVEDWNQLKHREHDMFMDTRFIQAVENAMGEECQFRYVIVYDEQSRPVASTCLSSVFSWYQLDSGIHQSKFRKRAINFLNKAVPWFLYGPIVVCGLPVSGVETQLRLTFDARREEVMQILNEALEQFAKEVKANSISFKDFNEEEALNLESLAELGYRRADIAPMNHTQARHADLAEFMQSIRGKDRAQIRRLQRKFDKAGLRVEFLTGKEGADKLYTEDVHKLYEATFERATQRLEKLPFQLMPEIARQLPEDAFFMYIYQEERIVAFCVSILDGETYHGLYAGIDEELNSTCDLYFNMFYHLVDHGLQQGVSKLAGVSPQPPLVC